MKKQLVIIAFFITCSFPRILGQSPADTLLLPAKVENGDTIVMANLDEITISSTYTKPVFISKSEERKFNRLLYNLKVVYPYAKMVNTKFAEMNEHLKNLTTEKERKNYTKQVEQEIKDKFEDKLKKLSVTQGRLLIKLVYRETGKTSYDLVKELRGGFSAFIYQALARLFGNNLKTQYDPLGEDKPIEELMVAMEAGLI